MFTVSPCGACFCHSICAGMVRQVRHQTSPGRVLVPMPMYAVIRVSVLSMPVVEGGGTLLDQVKPPYILARGVSAASSPAS